MRCALRVNSLILSGASMQDQHESLHQNENEEAAK